MAYSARLRLPVGNPFASVRRRCCTFGTHIHRHQVMVRASADEPPSFSQNDGPQEISLVRQFPGAGYTFMLAGALKIMTIGWVATSAPRECVRTVAGQYAQFLLLPVGLLLCLIAKKIVDSGLHESGRFMSFVLGITGLFYFGLYSVLYRYEPKTWYAQQRIQAAASHARTSPYAEEGPSNRRNKFIIQRQLEGEYDARTSAYYARAPEMQMQDVESRVDDLPVGMVGGAGAAEGGLGVGSTVAERRVGDVRSRVARRGVPPSMYETTNRMPGLDDSEF